ncbi:hypothetical protein [Bacillus sp. FJAT-28004]|uniref:hypothetical protein n=1 Tax=Bacillus sp. FJAT-28004 TaxID=1679165 RepID=UPI0006B4A998|nr:hypothetical protein [Bacillus sp. FJAT-28004]
MPAKQYNNDDTKIVKDAILFPYILDVLERDIQVIMASNAKMNSVYARLLRKAQNDATTSFYEVKNRMRNAGIKIFEEIREKDAFTTKFVVRGYQHEFKMFWSHLKIEIQTRLAAYLEVDLTDKKTDP